MPSTSTKGIKKNHKSPFRFSAMASFEELRPRKGRYGQYVVGYTNKDFSVTMSESIAETLCLYEPYNLTGEIKAFKGGMYLKVEKADLFLSAEYSKQVKMESDMETAATHSVR